MSLLRAELDHLPEVHHRHAVGDVPHDRQIVRDEDVGEAEVALQRVEEVDHLRADRDVERRDRLVEDDQLRVESERPRDADPLPLAARELVREAVRVLRREPDRPQQLVHPGAPLRAVIATVDAERLADDVADRHARVERRVRVLEDDLHLPAHLAHLAPTEVRDVAPVEDDLARRRLDQLDQRAREGRLAAAGLADEPERLARAQCQVDAVDGVDLADRALEDAGPDREVLDELLDAQDLVAGLRALVDACDRLRAHAIACEYLDW